MMQSFEPSHPYDAEAIANNGTTNHQHDRIEGKSESHAKLADTNESWQVAVSSRRKWCCCSWRKILYAVIPSSIVVAGIFVWMAAFSPNGVQNPFVGTDPPGATEALPWNSNGRGLTLRVENALETRYDTYFNEYIEKWQASNALSLTVTRLDHEPDCEPSIGRLKVCNGNYGSTDWRGLASYLIENGNMRSCIAQLNDYFLDAEGSVQQRYTM
jgi:hypothetical protein